MHLVAATILYFPIVFGTGFLCGPIRVFWLEPRLGEALATLCEAPFLLAASFVELRRPNNLPTSRPRQAQSMPFCCSHHLSQCRCWQIGRSLEAVGGS